MVSKYVDSMNEKMRLSASIDADVLAAARQAVEAGSAPSLSAFVNDALRLKLRHVRQLAELGAYIRAYESEHGEITDEEIRAATRRAGARAIPVRALGDSELQGEARSPQTE